MGVKWDEKNKNKIEKWINLEREDENGIWQKRKGMLDEVEGTTFLRHFDLCLYGK